MVLCSELKEDLRVMIGYFVEIFRRRGLKVNEDYSKEIMLEEEGLVCEVIVNQKKLDYVSEFKFLEFVLMN